MTQPELENEIELIETGLRCLNARNLLDTERVLLTLKEMKQVELEKEMKKKYGRP